MRALKFRGKEIQTGEWVYGFYTQGSRIDPIGGEERVRHIIHADMLYDIHPETLGQFTGATDLYGKEVYEGDVVMHDGDPDKEQRVVVFYDQAFCIVSPTEYADIKRGCNPYMNDYALPTCMNEWTVDGLLKVVGNVYDKEPASPSKCDDRDIIKALKAVVEEYDMWPERGLSKQDVRSWIEKHAEQILANSARTCKDEQTPAWSEEDSAMLDNIIAWIEGKWGTLGGKVGGREAFISFLKSLKDRFAWKPSEEQLENLSRAVNSGSYRISLLMELYKDLKKLREE